MHFQNLKIGARLGLAFAAVLALTAILTLVGAMRLQQVVDATADMDSAISKTRLADRWLASTRINRALTETRLRAADAQDLERINAKMKANSADINAVGDELDKLVASATGKKLFAEALARRTIEIWEGNPYKDEILNWLKDHNYKLRFSTGPTTETHLYSRADFTNS